MSTLNRPFSLQDVIDQFCQGTQINTLSGALDEVFGLSRTQDRLSDFDGHGSPVAKSDPSSEVDCATGNFRVKFKGTITDLGGLDTDYRFKYKANDPLLQNPSFTNWHTQPGSPPNGSAAVEVWSDDASASFEFVDGDDVYYKIQVKNAFNESGTCIFEEGTATIIEVRETNLAVPTISAAEVVNLDNDIYLSLGAGGNQNGFDIEIRKNGATAVGDTVQCSNGIATTTPEIITRADENLSNEDTWEVRVRATDSTGCFGTSAFTAWTAISFVGSTQTCPL